MDVVLELERYAELQNDELGETITYLCVLSRYSYCLSKEFNEALIKELGEQLDNFQENSKIVTRVVERDSYEVEELEWLN